MTIEEIKNLIRSKLDTVPSNNFTAHIKARHRNVYDEILKLTTWNTDAKLFVERIYCVLNDITSVEMRPVCNYCHGKVTFATLKCGYHIHCSSKKCKQNSISTKNKKRETCLKHWGSDSHMSSSRGYANYKAVIKSRYGYENPFQDEEVKDTIRQTCLDRYGVVWASKSDAVKNRTSETMMDRYGGNGPMCSEEVRKKSRTTCLVRYGVENYAQSTEYKTKIVESKIDNGTLYWPSIGKNEKALLDAVELEIGHRLIRQYKVKNYFIDGYCKETNTVYEVYEAKHKCQVDEDEKRKKIIVDTLKCEFVVIWDI